MEEIREKLKIVIRELFDFDVEPEISVAPEGFSADFSSNVAMKISKDLGKNPREIANKISEKIENCQVAGPGFLNFNLSDEYFQNKLDDFWTNFDKNISQDEYSRQTIVCEFSDPNPFKVLHVGHLYTSIIGDGIARLYELSGAKVVRANFGGDVGLHVAKTIWAVLDSGLELDELSIEDIAKCYVEGTRAYDEESRAHEEIEKLNAEIYKINLEDIHDGKAAGIYWRGRELSYQYFEDFYAKIGVKFDKFYPESSVAQRGLSEVKDGLSRGVYEMSDGAVVYRGEKVGLHTRVFINKGGLPTYEAKDVGLINTKWDDYHFDKSVVITGNDILDYMKVVLSSVSEMHPELAKRTVHLTHGNVKLQGGVKMSSRKGNFLKAVDVLDITAQTERERQEISFEDLDDKDKKIVLSAIKFAFLKVRIGGDVIFDPKESVSLTGCSGPYLLYSAVRAKKIIKKCKKGSGNTNYKMSNFERKLIKKFIEYPNILSFAVSEMASNKICNYLYELAQDFSRFYENCQVFGSDFEFERKKIVQIYLKILEHGLNLLGIEVPDEM